MKKELRKNFGIVVMLLDKMQRSVLVEKKGYFSSNQINFVRYIDMACGRLGEAVDIIFEDCKDVVEKKEDIIMTLRGYDDLYRTFRDEKECKPRLLRFEFDCGEKEKRKIYDIIVRFDELSDSIFVYIRRCGICEGIERWVLTFVIIMTVLLMTNKAASKTGYTVGEKKDGLT